MTPRWTYSVRFDEHSGRTQEIPLTPAQLGMSAHAVGTYMATGKIDRTVLALANPNPGGTALTTGEAMTAAISAVDLLQNAAARAGRPITTATPPATIASIAKSLGTPQWGPA